MVEEFIMRLEDGREIRITRELLEKKIPTDAAEELIKASTFAELIVKMTDRIASMDSGD